MQHELFGTTSVTMLFDAGMRVFAQARDARDHARWLLTEAQHGRDKATRHADATRELIRLYALGPAISGASDERLPKPFSVWIAPGHGAACDMCGKPISVDEMQYHVVHAHAEKRLHRACYRLRAAPQA